MTNSLSIDLSTYGTSFFLPSNRGIEFVVGEGHSELGTTVGTFPERLLVKETSLKLPALETSAQAAREAGISSISVVGRRRLFRAPSFDRIYVVKPGEIATFRTFADAPGPVRNAVLGALEFTSSMKTLGLSKTTAHLMQMLGR